MSHGICGKLRSNFYFVTLLTSLLVIFFLFSITPFVYSDGYSQSLTYIQQDFVSIQDAINKAENGSTVQIPSGTYLERVIVNKSISLVGEHTATTIIDGEERGTVVTITADNVKITGFTIQNSGWGWTRNGIYIHYADNCTVSNNYLFHNCQNIRLNFSRNSLVYGNLVDGDGYGIRLINSINCTATGNSVSDCIGGIHLENASICTVKDNYFTENSQGIRMYSPCVSNVIFENVVYNNTYDGMIEVMPGNATFFDNRIFHNSFIDNTNSFIYRVTGNVWDDGYPSGGNYWSQYEGIDLYSGPYQNITGRDGIGDTPFEINSYEADRYPLMNAYGARARNANTNLTYLTIQSAIDALETLEGHTLQVSSGVYYENINVSKPLVLVGEDRSNTIIDGTGVGTVLFVSAGNVSFSGFTVRNGGSLYPPYGDDCGIRLEYAGGCNITDCLVMNNRIGIYVYFSNTNVIQNNVVLSNQENGIWLWYSGNNILKGNYISNSSYNFGVSGGSFSHFNNIIDTSNLVNDSPIHYRIGVKDEVIDNETNIGTLYLINCYNVTIQDLKLRRNRHGLFCYNLTNSLIQRLESSENSYGIYLQQSSGNTIQDNECLNNWVGVLIYNSNNNIVNNNMVEDCEKGVSLYNANSNTLLGNSISKGWYGIRLYSSNYNQIFHNNLIDNTYQADSIESSQNNWNSSFEGNFWSDYTGNDMDRDGIGDFPYIIVNSSLTILDYHPLLGEFHSFSIYYEEKTYGILVITNSTILHFNFESIYNIINLRVNGSEGNYGFCRISIPHAIIEPEIIVIIDDGTTEVLNPNYFIHDDGTNRWIYFAYLHSTHEIKIVPEFNAVIFLVISMIMAFYALILRKD